jgi:hypothetical protein
MYDLVRKSFLWGTADGRFVLFGTQGKKEALDEGLGRKKNNVGA